MNESIVVAIDGPAGAGKSTASRLLAERLDFDFLDTGALYRCVTLAVLRSGIDSSQCQAVHELARNLDIRLENDTVWLSQENVTDAIRTPEVSGAIGQIADNPQVRGLLSEMQRNWARGKRVVSEGRDQGTEVFFDSPCKIFLTATDEERARRRHDELAAKGISISLEEVLHQQSVRDRADRDRKVGGLRRAEDAILLVTDGLTLNEVVDRMVAIVRERFPI